MQKCHQFKGIHQHIAENKVKVAICRKQEQRVEEGSLDLISVAGCSCSRVLSTV